MKNCFMEAKLDLAAAAATLSARGGNEKTSLFPPHQKPHIPEILQFQYSFIFINGRKFRTDQSDITVLKKPLMAFSSNLRLG